MTVGNRIQKLRKGKKLTQNELGHKIGVSGVTIGNWERGSHTPKGEHLIPLAKALSTSPDFLIDGPEKTVWKESEQNSIQSPVAPYNSISTLPIISSVMAGEWSEAIDNHQPNHAEEWQATTAKVSKSAFALRVQGRSMQNPNGHPTVPQGAIVIVDPQAEATNGKIVVAKLPMSNEVTIKRLVIDGPMIYLEPLNPEFKLIPIDKECVIVGVVKQVIQDI